MRRALLAVLASICLMSSAFAASQKELMTPIRQFIDGFNSSDTKSAFAAYASGDVTIVDEFAPYRWTGPNAAHEWADAYDKHAKSTGVSDGSVNYGQPTRTEVEGKVAP